jgi:hypothetical protein
MLKFGFDFAQFFPEKPNPRKWNRTLSISDSELTRA